MIHDANWHELQYLPSLTVVNAHEIASAWRYRAALTRAKCPPLSDFKYGSHPRENIDLFRAENARGTLVYIHGGYWRGFSKLETSFVAENFVRQGISVALVNYPLCPDVTIADIRHSTLKAFAFLYKSILGENEKAHIVVSGHSAGGHLAALHMTTNWQMFGLPKQPFRGVVSLSGVFDVSPLIQTSLNNDLRLTEETATALNLTRSIPVCRCPVVLAVGGNESDEFHRQSRDQAEAWKSVAAQFLDVPDFNHFTIVDSIAEADGVLHKLVLNMLA